MADWREGLARSAERRAWADLEQRRYERSPEYMAQMLRERQAAELRMQDWQKQRNPAYIQQMEQQKILQQKAEMDASMLEMRYTAKDKAQIAKYENQARKAYQLLMSGQISQDDYSKFKAINESNKLGVIPGMLPSLSPYPKGQGVGDSYEKFGGIVTRMPDGSEKIIFRPDQMPEYQAKEQELIAVKEKAKNDAEIQKEQLRFKQKLATTKIDDPDNLGGKRSMTPDEMRAAYEQVYPSQPMPEMGEVEHAKEYLNTMIDRWGNAPPPDVLEGMKKAQAVLKMSKERAW